MTKLIRTSLFILMTLIIGSPVYAQNVSLTLTPNGTKVIENTYLWSLNATCKIQCSNSDNTILIRVQNNKGTVNGQNLADGQVKSVTIHNHDSISVSAEPGTKVTLVNKSNEVVQADCLAM